MSGRRGGRGGVGGRGGRGEQAMVPDAEFTSYYGRPVIKEPVWKDPDVPAYLFLGGLAGASSVLAVSAQLSGHHELARAAKVSALVAISASAAALIHDLGRPDRFANMLRVFKLSSPMSVGSWLLAGYGPIVGAAAVSEVTGLLPRAGLAATIGAGVLGPAVATYTAALICDTAVPAWHEGHREMPYVFAGSAASAAGGLGLVLTRAEAADPARDLAVLGAAVELIAKRELIARLRQFPMSPGSSPAPAPSPSPAPGSGSAPSPAPGPSPSPGAGSAPGPRPSSTPSPAPAPVKHGLAEPYETGGPGKLLRAAELVTAAGLAGAVLGRRSRAVSALSGAALVAASAMTRWGIFRAGLASARDPKYTIIPQRSRLSRP